MVKVDFSEFSANLKTLNDRVMANAPKIMEYTMTDAEGYAKQNAPWRDRTGNARGSISHKTISSKDLVTGVIGIGVFYGKYLELSNQGKYRIIRPTVDVYRSKLLQNLKEIL